VLQNIEKIVGSQFKNITTLENFHHLAFEHIRDDICRMCYSDNEQTVTEGICIIQEYVCKETSTCI
jgi:hypothetical protein